MFNIGIVGNGFVGKATKLLKSKSININVYDIRPEACEPLGTQLSDLEKCDIIFYCLPTPLNHDSSCYTKIIEDAVTQLKNPFKVIRSTVPVGFSQKINCFFMPEFLTEANWKQDFITSSHWVFGLLENLNNDENIEKLNNEFKYKIETLFKISQNEGSIDSSKIYWVTNSEAELLKLTKNCFLASKVSIMNEIYHFAKYKNINYENIKKMLLLDPRIGTTHLNVPGINGLYGYGGTCFPKDTHSLYSQFQKLGLQSYHFQASLLRNEYEDRKEREWKNDFWRTTLPTNKKISLVAGGAGFIGSNLCKRLLQEDHIVICLDNFQTGNINNVKQLMLNPNFILKKADIINKQFFPKIDYIWHFACPASPPKYQIDGVNTLKINFIGTLNLLELAKTHNCPFIFSSTSEVYGDPAISPQNENYYGNVNTVGNRSCYDEGKRCAETLVYEFRRNNPELSNKLKIIRIFNTYGPNMDIDDGRVITNYIKSILNNKPITIYGNGLQNRSFCYIDDLIDGIILMMNSDEVGPINLGNPNNNLTMIDLKLLFDKFTNKENLVEYLSIDKDDPKQRLPDITLAKNKLNWEPKISIEDGIKITFEYFLNL